MAVFDPSTHGDLAGDIIATSITAALASGVPIWRAVGNTLDLYYAHKWIEVTFDPSLTTYSSGSGAPFSVSTIALQSDPITGLPVAIWIKVGYGPMDWSKIWPVDVAGIVNEITTNETFVTSITNTVIGSASSPSVASTLYPSEIADPNLRSSVVCFGGFNFHPTPSQTYDETGSFAAGVMHYWTQIPGISTWQRNDPGALYGQSTADGGGGLGGGSSFTYPLQVGDHFLIADSQYAQYCWIYEVVTAGDGTTSAIIRRATDSNTTATVCNGATVEVAGGGVRNGFTAYGIGNFVSITTANPITVDTTVINTGLPTTSYTPTTTYGLLTGSQLSSVASVDNTDVLTSDTTASAGTAVIPFSLQFETELGTPAASSFPASLVNFAIEAFTLSGLTGTAVIQAVITQNLGGATILTASSAPVTNGTTTGITFQGLPGAAVPLSPTDRLSIAYFLDYTSSTPVSAVLTYSSPARGTWVQVPFQLAMVGITPTGSIPCPFGDTYPSIDTTPAVKAQCVGNFDDLAASATIPVELNAWALADIGFTGTATIKIGGTKDAADGTTAGTLTVTGTGSYALIQIVASITNPGGKLPIKLVMSSSDAAHVFVIQGVVLVIGVAVGGSIVGGGGGGVSLPIAESSVTGLVADLAAKQATLVSGTTIKTVGGVSVLGAGDIPVGGVSNWDGGQANTNYGGTIAINGGTA
jgi:hypothetical protein